jgi:hypothetical protein
MTVPALKTCLEDWTPNREMEKARKRAGLSAAPLTAAAVATSTAAPAAAVASAATAIAATTAAAAIATTAAAISPTTAASTTGRASFTGASFVHGQGPTFDGLAIEFRDRFLGVCFRCHGDKGEAARLTGELILHQRDL